MKETYTIKVTTRQYNDFLRFQAMWEQYELAYKSEFETARAALMARETWGEGVLRRLVAEEIIKLIQPESYQSADACFESLANIEDLLRSDKFLKRRVHL